MIEQKLDKLIERYSELERLLIDPDVIRQNELYRGYLMEHSRLQPLVAKSQVYKKVKKELKSLSELKSSGDEEIRNMAAFEYDDLLKKELLLVSELKLALLPPDPNNEKGVIMEIRAGTGGDEAALFAGDLFRMYTRYAESKGWKTEIMDSHPTGLGGFKEVVFSVEGKGVYGNLKYEKGVHRVQRVPHTEASGRIHTSAVSVAVLPEAEEIEVNLKTEDLRIDTYRASGAGGQHVNKTESAIRLTHIPTGIVVTCQDERSQMKNRAKAMKIMVAKLYEEKMIAHEKQIKSDRKQQVGSGDRSEKIRTYNFPQNRITDHRINFSVHNINEVMDGDMEELISEIIKIDNESRLKALNE
jgi:peptide chain release factor 1